jgi:hypothetical protein
MSAFNEVALFEQNAPTGSFYSSGSAISVGETPGSFSGPLRDKAQIRLSFKVKNPVKMLANTSSIYYFSPEYGQWRIPPGAVSDHVGPFEKFAFNTNWSNPSGTIGGGYVGYTVGSLVVEDAKCFDARGRTVSSGTLDIYRQVPDIGSQEQTFNQNAEGVGRNLSGLGVTQRFEYLVDDYVNSVQRNALYSAQDSEIFSTNISEPFLVEKAVVEMPISMGPTWFQDRTASPLALATGTYSNTQPFYGSGDSAYNFYTDSGGPALTVALFSQKKYGIEKIRDLIFSGTITHYEDSTKTVKPREIDIFRRDEAIKVVYVDAFGLSTTPAAIVHKNNGSFFTGSIKIQMQPAVTNGFGAYGGLIELIADDDYPIGTFNFASYTPEKYLIRWENLYSRPIVELNELLGAFSNIRTIDVFGRGMTGFAPSGGSIFGGEYCTPKVDRFVLNPFYIEDESERANSLTLLSSSMNDAILAGPAGSLVRPFGVQALALMIHSSDFDFFKSSKDSPYLINPGEKLVLSISKTRPAISASGHNIPNATWPGTALKYADVGGHQLVRQVPLTGSVNGHDVTLQTGSINITLYGSYVRGGNSYIP